MAEIGISVAAKAAEYTVDPVATQLSYMWNYKTNFENLEKQLLKLEDTRATVQHSVEEATRNAEEIEQNVVNWLDSVNKINEEATKIIEDNNRANMRCFKSLCPDLKMRYRHSKKAADKANDVSVLQNEGKFDRISYRNLPEETWHPSSKPFEYFESRTSTLTYVINALSNPDVHMVGVHGMGGIGKTTLAREVGRKTEESKIFDVVVFVEVSESPDIRTIQGVIADKLGLEFHQETKPGRANTLRERLKKEMKILLILDNIWESLDLEKVGIPFNDDHRGCKLLLTARKANILSDEMGCDCENNFPIGILNEKEAWDLFKKMVGSCVEGPNLQSLAFNVAKKCGGLPIAIVTVAKALKNKEECEWKSALDELQHPSIESLEESVATKAYSCIKLSYNHLDTEELKSAFLLCCTMECTYKASIEELLRYGVGLNLFKTIKTMEKARYRVNTLVRKLKSSSLLLDTPDSKWFSIHDVVRDVGRAIAFKDHNKFTVTDDVIPREWKDKNTMKNCTSISLHDITELPNTKLDCPLLQFLYMKGKNAYSKIPDNFFIGMPDLRVLHLIEMELSPPPPSLCCLVNLQTLCLDCSWLRDTGFIADIKDLEILVLSCHTIEQLPTEISQLIQLRVLDLSRCYKLAIVPPSIISKLTQLEELYLNYGFDNWHVEGLDNESGIASLDELKHLSQLTTLHIYIRDHKMVPKGLFSQKLQRYNICIGGWNRTSKYGTSKTVKLKSDDIIVLEDEVITKLKEIEELCLDGRQSVKNALYELDSDGFPQLKHFEILNNPDLVYIVDSSKKWALPCDAFPLLETLSLSNLIGFEKICHGQLTPNSFCQLRTVNVDGCDNLKNVFSLSIAKHLSQLQDIRVSNSKHTENIFTIGRRNDINSNEEIDRVVLDQLHSLSLSTLPKLRSFCSEEEVFVSTSNEIILEDIPMPLFDGKVQLPNLKTLNLYEVNFETIWHHQHPTMSPCFQNLTHLSVQSCNNLRYLFSFSTLGSFMQLQDLTIRECKVLETIVRIDELGNNVEHPSLKKLKINTCPKIKAFIFDEKVSFPNLEEIQISNMKNLEMIWHNQLTKDSMKNAQHCQKLCKVDINSCKSLKTLFPLSTARNLFQLKDLNVTRCDGIEEIVAKEGAEDAAARTFVFPQLTCLTMMDLQELKCFYPGTHTIEWPVLKELKLTGCEKIDELFALELFTFQKNILEGQLDIPAQPLSLVKKVFSNLEKLRLDGNSSRMISHSQFPEILFPKLKHLNIHDQKDQPADLPLEICQRSHNLESLSLEGGPNKEIFRFEVVRKHTLTKKLSISGFENLEQIWKRDSKVNGILQNFEDLYVSWCDSLVTLIPPSACFQNLTILTVDSCGGLLQLVSSSTAAKSLVGLKEMKIQFCYMMTKVVADDEGAITEDEIINFSKLKSLELVCLSRLTSFCSYNYTFNFPSLEILSVQYCRKMKTFASGVVLTPMLRKIKLDYKDYYCEGDVNTSMQQIHEELFFSNKRLSLSLEDIKMILQKFPEHQFSRLKSLAVSDDESTVLPFQMLQQSHNLEQLKSADRSNKEILLCEEVEKQAETLAQLSLKELPTMSPFFQNLTDLSIRSCNNLKYLFSFSTLGSFVQLQDLTIRECKVLEAIIRIDEVGNNVKHPSLKKLRIEKCPEMKAFIFNDKEGAEDAAAMTFVFPHLTCLKLEDLQEIRCFYPGIYTMEWPVLKELNLIGCDKIDHSFVMELFAFQKNIPESQLDIPAQPLSLVKKVFSNIEKLRLDGNSSRMISQSQFPEILFPKLKHLNIQNQKDQPADLTLEICQRPHNLESLSLERGSNKEIFWFEVVGKHTLTKKLSISDFENLEQIWKKDSKVNGILQNLEELDVSECDSLVTLIPPSACFKNLTILTVHSCGGLLQLVSSSTAAKSLVGLKEMTIGSCDKLTKVVADDEGAITEDEIINFSKLKSLKLIDLPRLTSFCSWNYTFNFPSLERLSVQDCPKMKTFASGVVLTPMLREIELDNEDYYCEGDVNTSMQQIHEKLVFSGERLSLSPRDIKMILQKSPEHQFPKLKSLEVFDDESTVFPFGMIQRFHNLEKLKLIDSSYKEIFICEEVEKHAETLARLKSLDLDKLDNLEQIWKQDSKLDLILHTLETLRVRKCNSLITLIPASASFQNLKSLQVRSCNGLISLLSSSIAKSLVRLEHMGIRSCNTMTKIVATEDVEEDKIVIFSKLQCLELNDLSSLASFCSGSHTTLNFPSLESLYVIKCPKMKFFSSGVSSTPLLQRIQYDWDKSIWVEGDLNTTIQWIHEELNPKSSTKGCVSHIE